MTLVSDSISAMVFFIMFVRDNDARQALFSTIGRLFEGLSDIAKAVLIILVADTLLGYHSEEGEKPKSSSKSQSRDAAGHTGQACAGLTPSLLCGSSCYKINGLSPALAGCQPHCAAGCCAAAVQVGLVSWISSWGITVLRLRRRTLCCLWVSFLSLLMCCSSTGSSSA